MKTSFGVKKRKAKKLDKKEAAGLESGSESVSESGLESGFGLSRRVSAVSYSNALR